jgi:aspartate-semialdehyde dehydrogenase
VPSLDIIDNVVPSSQVKRTRWRRKLKILEHLTKSSRTLISSLAQAAIELTLRMARIHIRGGPRPIIEQIGSIQDFRARHSYQVPSAQPNSCSPRRTDLNHATTGNTGSGQSVVVGRVRKGSDYDFQVHVLDTILFGAAGGGILSAELYVANGLANGAQVVTVESGACGWLKSFVNP